MHARSAGGVLSQIRPSESRMTSDTHKLEVVQIVARWRPLTSDTFSSVYNHGSEAAPAVLPLTTEIVRRENH